MADNTCGPSNAFKGLARHVDQDRTLQQDRVVAGPHHARQAFRSSPGDPAAANGQFAAFQSGNAGLPGFEMPNMHPHPAFAPHPRPHPHPHLQPAGPAPNVGADWVNDFQRNMNLNDIPPLHSSLHHPPTGQNPAMGFGSLPASGATYYPPSSMHQHTAPTMMGSAGILPHQNGYLQDRMPTGAFYTQLHQDEDGMLDPLIQQQLDDEFTAAMDNWMRENGPSEAATNDTPAGVVGDEPAAQSMHSASHTTQSGIDTDFEVAQAQSHAQALGQSEMADLPLLSPEEPILAGHQSQLEREGPPETQPAEARPQVDTELARAAQQLVDSVSDNDSEKFRNSSFLQMMRRIAAEEVTVQGNDLVETPRAPNDELGSGSHVTGSGVSASQPESRSDQDVTPPTG